jgi:hypothetical protein
VAGNAGTNPHNRHLHREWAPRSCVEEYHHLIFATATSAVKDVLGKWERKLQEKRAALARRRAVAAAGRAAAVIGRVGSASRRPALGKSGTGGSVGSVGGGGRGVGGACVRGVWC